MSKYSGKGWHYQSVRHSNARKYGKAGGKYASVRIRKAKKSDSYRRGIHLLKPTPNEIANAKEDAEAKGFKTIWIHNKKHFGYAQRGFKTFPLKDGYEIIAHWEKTRNGFRHIVVLMKDGNEIDRAKATYLNRTWESFEYETAIRNLLDKTSIFSPAEKKELLEKMSGKAHEEVESKFKTIGTIASLGDIFGKTQKERIEWKKRMLKAGLGEGLMLPEDFDKLSEDEQEARLDKAIEFMKPKKKEEPQSSKDFHEAIKTIKKENEKHYGRGEQTYGFYNKETNELEDAGTYKSEKEALQDFEKWDKPKGRYMLDDEGNRWD